MHTLPTEVVEKITPGNPKNPDNVQRVEFILSQVVIVLNKDKKNHPFLSFYMYICTYTAVESLE